MKHKNLFSLLLLFFMSTGHLHAFTNPGHAAKAQSASNLCQALKDVGFVNTNLAMSPIVRQLLLDQAKISYVQDPIMNLFADVKRTFGAFANILAPIDA